MPQFEIILKNEKIKSYRLFALFLVLLNLAILIFLMSNNFRRYEAATSLLLIGIYIFIRLYIAKKKNNENYLDGIIFFILAGCWIGLQNYLLVLVCVLLGILYHLALQKLRFVFNNMVVQKLNFPKSVYTWDLFTNVMIRDKILTLDLKNNKLMQLEIEHEEAIDEALFNEFARQQIDQQNEAL